MRKWAGRKALLQLQGITLYLVTAKVLSAFHRQATQNTTKSKRFHSKTVAHGRGIRYNENILHNLKERLHMNWQQACELPYYNGTDLGANYTPAATTFKLWAPTAAAVTVELFATGTDAEPNAHHLGAHHLQWERDGVWSLTLSGDWKNTYYLYHLQFHDGRTADAVDPYARTAGANGQRAMVLDLDAAAPEGWAEDKRPVIPPHARSVWEVHVADFSADEHSGVPAEYRGKFMGFVPGDTTLDGDGVHPTCLNYLKDLGVSHVQLQPIFDYETVDESRPDGGYNWGYDPQNYNVPEGSFATDPFHGEVRVRECRAMVAALHRAGLGVVMDVVYNHTYHSDSNLERTVPGYWNRRWPNDQMTNGSGCGCDLASERPMVRKYIVDSILYWAQTYHIDGFRFDLMALEDADTMNAIRAALDALPGGQDILLYGEPWQGGSTNFEGGARPADKRALDVLSDRIGFFCDDTRDSIKGNVFDAGNAGYVNGAPQHGYEVLHSIGAWRGGQHGYWPRQAGQVVQYISAHDNLTLWDKLAAVGRRRDYDAPDAELLAQNRLAAGIYLTCQGLPFMQAGEEWGRTKHGDHNRYKGPLETNKLDWTRAHRPEFAALTAFYRGMLAIRRTCARIAGAYGEPQPFVLALQGWLIGFIPESPDPKDVVVVYYNPERTHQWVSLPIGSWRKLTDGVHAGTTPFGPIYRDAMELPPVSVTVLRLEQ